ncbi:hypothetical protein SAY87_005388 [Trapa incisa]|uniref:TCP domain-containing protein n=1 Tax=Trapa incisa TaxID=236973 RepID=A0AAN7KCD4_9MYRT|nr:hypothetical protein SAY87_005388 [Trapa incisa]
MEPNGSSSGPAGTNSYTNLASSDGYQNGSSNNNSNKPAEIKDFQILVPASKDLEGGGGRDDSTRKQEVSAAATAAPRRSLTKDRHKKVDGRGRRIRMPALCAARIFQLTRELGHKTDGETIQWLLQQAEPSIIAATGTGTVPASTLTTAGPSVSEHGTSNAGGMNSGKMEGLGQNLIGFQGLSRQGLPIIGGGFGIARSQVGGVLWPSAGGVGPGGFVSYPDIPSSSFGFHGVEFPTVNMGLVNFQAFFPGSNNQQLVPGLELGLSQDNSNNSVSATAGGGVLGSQGLSHLYHQQQQEAGHGRENGAGITVAAATAQKPQAAVEDDDSQGSKE